MAVAGDDHHLKILRETTKTLIQDSVVFTDAVHEMKRHFKAANFISASTSETQDWLILRRFWQVKTPDPMPMGILLDDQHNE